MPDLFGERTEARFIVIGDELRIYYSDNDLSTLIYQYFARKFFDVWDHSETSPTWQGDDAIPRATDNTMSELEVSEITQHKEGGSLEVDQYIYYKIVPIFDNRQIPPFGDIARKEYIVDMRTDDEQLVDEDTYTPGNNSLVLKTRIDKTTYNPRITNLDIYRHKSDYDSQENANYYKILSINTIEKDTRNTLTLPENLDDKWHDSSLSEIGVIEYNLVGASLWSLWVVKDGTYLQDETGGIIDIGSLTEDENARLVVIDDSDIEYDYGDDTMYLNITGDRLALDSMVHPADNSYVNQNYQLILYRWMATGEGAYYLISESVGSGGKDVWLGTTALQPYKLAGNVAYFEGGVGSDSAVYPISGNSDYAFYLPRSNEFTPEGDESLIYGVYLALTVGTNYLDVYFCDPGLLDIEPHPYPLAESITMNYKDATYHEGRLYALNLKVTDGGVTEYHPDKIAFSEYQQPDVITLGDSANIMELEDVEGGEGVAIKSIAGKLYAFKKYAVIVMYTNNNNPHTSNIIEASENGLINRNAIIETPVGFFYVSQFGKIFHIDNSGKINPNPVSFPIQDLLEEAAEGNDTKISAGIWPEYHKVVFSFAQSPQAGDIAYALDYRTIGKIPEWSIIRWGSDMASTGSRTARSDYACGIVFDKLVDPSWSTNYIYGIRRGSSTLYQIHKTLGTIKEKVVTHGIYSICEDMIDGGLWLCDKRESVYKYSITEGAFDAALEAECLYHWYDNEFFANEPTDAYQVHDMHEVSDGTYAQIFTLWYEYIDGVYTENYHIFSFGKAESLGGTPPTSDVWWGSHNFISGAYKANVYESELPNATLTANVDNGKTAYLNQYTEYDGTRLTLTYDNVDENRTVSIRANDATYDTKKVHMGRNCGWLSGGLVPLLLHDVDIFTDSPGGVDNPYFQIGVICKTQPSSEFVTDAGVILATGGLWKGNEDGTTVVLDEKIVSSVIQEGQPSYTGGAYYRFNVFYVDNTPPLAGYVANPLFTDILHYFNDPGDTGFIQKITAQPFDSNFDTMDPDNIKGLCVVPPGTDTVIFLCEHLTSTSRIADIVYAQSGTEDYEKEITELSSLTPWHPYTTLNLTNIAISGYLPGTDLFRITVRATHEMGYVLVSTAYGNLFGDYVQIFECESAFNNHEDIRFLLDENRELVFHDPGGQSIFNMARANTGTEEYAFKIKTLPRTIGNAGERRLVGGGVIRYVSSVVLKGKADIDEGKAYLPKTIPVNSTAIRKHQPLPVKGAGHNIAITIEEEDGTNSKNIEIREVELEVK